jgi:hypothetical protein
MSTMVVFSRNMSFCTHFTTAMLDLVLFTLLPGQERVMATLTTIFLLDGRGGWEGQTHCTVKVGGSQVHSSSRSNDAGVSSSLQPAQHTGHGHHQPGLLGLGLPGFGFGAEQ